MKDSIKYWIELSDYDLETAEAMLISKRFLYVGFMCHQTIEKAFKAYFIKKKNQIAPFSHSLSYIAKKGEFFQELTEKQVDYIDQIEPLNIETRYPSYKERLLKSLTEQKCQELIDYTKQLHKWIKKKL